MRPLFTFALIVLLAARLLGFSAENPSQKYLRYIERADQLYDDYVFLKAIEFYKKAIEEDASSMSYPALRIADSYRLINDNEQAVQWYEKVLSELSEEDRIHYAQALLETGKPQKAGEVAASVSSEKLVADRFESLERRKEFFRDSAAYLVVQSADMNSDQADFSPAYYENGVVFVSNRKTSGILRSTYYWDESYFLDLYLQEGEEVTTFSKRVNTIFHEGPATFYDGATKVIFTRNNFNSGRKSTSSEGVNKLKLFYSERKPGKANWSKPMELPFNSDEYSVGHPSITEDGKTLYFSSDRPGTRGKADIFRSTFENGKWSEPQPLPGHINTLDNELFPFIQDGHILYFASEGHPGIGGLDIYKVDLDDPEGTVINLGYPINTEKDDFGLIIDGHQGYFSSNREGGLGKDDIYEFDLFLFDIVASLRDSQTRELLTGDLQVVDQTTQKKVASVAQSQSVQFEGMRGRTYEIKGASESHSDGSMTVATITFPKEETVQQVDILLDRITKEIKALVVKNYGQEDQVFRLDGQPVAFAGGETDLEKYIAEKHLRLTSLVKVQAVYYDYDDFTIREDAAADLEKLAAVLQNYPEMQVVLTSHTDSRGSDAYNQELSQKRAEAAREFLVRKKVAPARITIQAKGEAQQVKPCEEACDEPTYQLNRRTEIKLAN